MRFYTDAQGTQHVDRGMGFVAASVPPPAMALGQLGPATDWASSQAKQLVEGTVALVRGNEGLSLPDDAKNAIRAVYSAVTDRLRAGKRPGIYRNEMLAISAQARRPNVAGYWDLVSVRPSAASEFSTALGTVAFDPAKSAEWTAAKSAKQGEIIAAVRGRVAAGSWPALTDADIRVLMGLFGVGDAPGSYSPPPRTTRFTAPADAAVLTSGPIMGMGWGWPGPGGGSKPAPAMTCPSCGGPGSGYYCNNGRCIQDVQSQLAGPLGVSMRNPCPPPNNPNHTQWNGKYCCLPGACVNKPAPPGTLAMTGCTRDSDCTCDPGETPQCAGGICWCLGTVTTGGGRGGGGGGAALLGRR